MKNLFERTLGVLLARKGWNMADLARACGASHQALRQRCGRTPTRDTLDMVSNALGMVWGDLLDAMKEERQRLELEGESLPAPAYRDDQRSIVRMEVDHDSKQ